MAGELENPIRVADIARVYKGWAGIEIRHLFTSDTTALRRQEPLGYYQFTGALPGDEAFYNSLMEWLTYEAEDKCEFREGASWIPKGATVLDVGCGPGRFSVFCDGAYKGIDLNPGAVAEGRKTGRPVFQEDLADQPADHFDAVTMFQVLEHVCEPVEFARMAARCVKPGGLMIVSVPDMDGVFGAAVNQYLNYPPHHLTWWDEDALRNLMHELDMDTVKIWREPLREEHLRIFFYALLYPRRSRHLDFSLTSRFFRLFGALLSVLFRRRTIPFVKGMAIMIAGRKRSSAVGVAI